MNIKSVLGYLFAGVVATDPGKGKPLSDGSIFSDWYVAVKGFWLTILGVKRELLYLADQGCRLSHLFN